MCLFNAVIHTFKIKSYPIAKCQSLTIFMGLVNMHSHGRKLWKGNKSHLGYEMRHADSLLAILLNFCPLIMFTRNLHSKLTSIRTFFNVKILMNYKNACLEMLYRALFEFWILSWMQNIFCTINFFEFNV